MNKPLTPLAAAKLPQLRIIFLLFLAFTFFSEHAAAYPYTKTVKPGTGKTTYNPQTNTTTSNYPLPYGPAPGPGHGATINPNDYAMCGVLNLSGDFDENTVAEVVVIGDHFNVQRTWTGKNKSGGPTLVVTCALFKDFTGVPPVSDAGTFLPPTVVPSTGGVEGKVLVGGATQACIWAGVSGALTQKNKSAAYVYAQYYSSTGGSTVVVAQSAQGAAGKLSTYSFCNGYSGSGTLSWKYYQDGNMGESSLGGTLIPPPPKIAIKLNWCYLDGIGAQASSVNAGLGLSSIGDYTFEAASGSTFWFNCLPLKQQ